MKGQNEEVVCEHCMEIEQKKWQKANISSKRGKVERRIEQEGYKIQ